MIATFLHQVAATVEAKPSRGYIGTAVSWLLAALGWGLENAGQIGAAFGCAAAVFGAIAGWYTMRIQRREFLRHENTPPFHVEQPGIIRRLQRRFRRRR